MTSYVYPQPLPLKLNNLVTPEPRKTNSVTLKVLFAIIIALFSLDLGFFKLKHSRTRAFVKTFCGFQLMVKLISIGYVVIAVTDLNYKAWLYVSIIEHTVVVFILIFTTKSTFFYFYRDLMSIDKRLGVDISSQLELFIITLPTFNTCFKILVNLAFCVSNEIKEHCRVPIYDFTIRFIMGLSNEVFLAIFFIIYYLLYRRMKVFTKFVCDGSSDVVASQYLYKSIADLTDSIKPVYNNLYAVILFFHTIIMIMTAFRPLLITDLQDTWLNIATMMAVFLYFTTLFLPAFAAGLMSAQVHQLKVVLQNRLLQERDQPHASNIEYFLRYIEVRPLRVTIWKVIPLNWQLPVITVNLMATYLIVALQFSHRY